MLDGSIMYCGGICVCESVCCREGGGTIAVIVMPCAINMDI